LIAIVDDRLLFQETLREVRQMRQWVLDAEHILSADFLQEGSVVTNELVARRFDAWRAKLACQLRQDGLSEEQRCCLQQFLQVLSNQRCHLVQCYDQQDFRAPTMRWNGAFVPSRLGIVGSLAARTGTATCCGMEDL